MISLISGIKEDKKLTYTKNRLMVARGKGSGVGEMGKVRQKIPTSSYKTW